MEAVLMSDDEVFRLFPRFRPLLWLRRLACKALRCGRMQSEP